MWTNNLSFVLLFMTLLFIHSMKMVYDMGLESPPNPTVPGTKGNTEKTRSTVRAWKYIPTATRTRVSSSLIGRTATVLKRHTLVKSVTKVGGRMARKYNKTNEWTCARLCSWKSPRVGILQTCEEVAL